MVRASAALRMPREDHTYIVPRLGDGQTTYEWSFPSGGRAGEEVTLLGSGEDASTAQSTLTES